MKQRIPNIDDFINESSKGNITQILQKLTKDDLFIKYLNDHGENVSSVTGPDLTMGLCAYVAKYIEEIHGIGEALGSEGPAEKPFSHAFIKYNGKYYDSATPKGVKNVWELWFFDDMSYSVRIDYEDFKKEIAKNIKPYVL